MSERRWQLGVGWIVFYCLMALQMVVPVSMVWADDMEGETSGLPRIQQFVTPRGASVVLIENHAIPMVEVRILVRGGGVYDPPGREGVASLTSWMFNEGAGELDSVAFQERLHYYGISLSASASTDTIEVTMMTLSEHLEEAWTRLGDALMRPRMAAVDFQRAVRERTAELIKSEEDPDFRVIRAVYPMIFGKHPYARPVNGTVESLKKIELADLRRHHDATFRGAGMVVAVAGDVTLEQLKQMTSRHLAGLNGSPGPFSKVAKAEPGEEGSTRHIEMDLPQTTLRVGVVGISRDDPDFYAMTVMNQILGGGGLPSRLTTSIREKRGLAYGVSSYFLPLPGQGPFLVGTETKTESAGEVLSLIHQELRRMVEEEVGEEELRDTKRYLTGSFPLQLDGLDKLAETWCRVIFYQRGLDYLDKWPERIRAVTAGDIQRVAKRILVFKRLHTVSVGKRKPELVGDGIPPQTPASPPSP
ncbi:MAG: insulinase family protein [Magnetococcus sp. YQC-5]